MRRKYFFMVIALLGILYYISGKPSEIADKVMIHAVGVDASDDGYKVTMQVYTPGGSGGETAIDPSLPNVTLVKGNGSTVGNAVQQCMLKLGGDVFLGQNRIILFGQNVDLSKKDELFSYFLLSSEAFLNVNCAAAEETAEALLELPLSAGSIASEKFPRMILSGENAGTCCSMTLTELLSSMDSAEQAVILPVFSITKKHDSSSASKDDNGESSSSEDKLEDVSPIAIEKGALYINGKYRTDITCEQMGLAAALNGTGHFVSIENEDDSRSARTFKINSREVRASSDENSIVFEIICQTAPADPQLIKNPVSRDKQNRRYAALIEQNAQELCDEFCSLHSAELIGADQFLKRFYPKLFLLYKDDPEQLYDHISFKVSFT